MAAESLGYLSGYLFGGFILAWLIFFLYGKMTGKEVEHMGMKVLVLGIALTLFTNFSRIVEQLPSFEDGSSESIEEITGLLDSIDAEELTFSDISQTRNTPTGIAFQQYLSDIGDLQRAFDLKVAGSPNIHIETLDELTDSSQIQQLLENVAEHRQIDSEYYQDSIDITQKYGESILAIEPSNTFEEGFIEGTEESLPEAIASLEDIKDAGENYYNAYTAYYQFVLDHQGSLSIEDEQVILDTEELLNQYNELIDEVDDREIAYLTVLEQAQQEGQESLSSAQEGL